MRETLWWAKTGSTPGVMHHGVLGEVRAGDYRLTICPTLNVNASESVLFELEVSAPRPDGSSAMVAVDLTIAELGRLMAAMVMATLRARRPGRRR